MPTGRSNSTAVPSAARPSRSASRAAPPTSASNGTRLYKEDHSLHSDASIGPNAILRTLEAVRAGDGEAGAAALLRAAGLERYALSEPSVMVPERDVSLLYRALRARVGEAAAAELGRDAGARTARYLLANRIPGFVQSILRRLPARLAASALLAAISRNTWTFAGSGSVGLHAGRPVRIAIEACPLCRDEALARPACDYYAGTFEGLFRELVSGNARAVESACAATGADACRFEIAY